MQIPRFHFSEIKSSQDQAMLLVDEGKAPPFLVTADHMTEARGQWGRPWSFEPEKSLGFSLCIRLENQFMHGLSLIVGLAVAEALEPSVQLQLKWTNDLYLDGKKVGGVLIESKNHNNDNLVIVGVGINQFDLSSAAYKGVNRSLNPEELAASIMHKVVERKELGLSNLMGAFNERLVSGEISLDDKGEIQFEDSSL